LGFHGRFSGLKSFQLVYAKTLTIAPSPSD
jgi:hypothetical protein